MRCISLMLTITLASLLAIVTSGLEAQATSVIAVFHQGYGEDGWLWSMCTPDGTNWTQDAQVESVDPTNGFVTGGVGMSGSPSAVVYPPQ
jgi:hypothetical protein